MQFKVLYSQIVRHSSALTVIAHLDWGWTLSSLAYQSFYFK